MTEKWLPQLFFSQDKLENQEPLNSWFELNGYYSKLSILNGGSALVYYLILACLLCLMWAFQALHYQRGHKWLRALLIWNGIARLTLSQYPPIFMAALINTFSEDSDSNSGHILSVTITVFTFLALPAIYYGLKSPLCDALTHGLKRGSEWNLVFMGRYLGVIFCLVCFTDVVFI